LADLGVEVIPMKCLRKVFQSQVSYEICSQSRTGGKKGEEPEELGTIKLEV